jgi:hypothetical protein
MDNTTMIRIVAGVFAVALLAICLLFLAFLSGVLRKCSPSSRTMEPGMVWLCLIPLVSLIWNFFVVLAIADSLGNEFKLRNIPSDDAKPGKNIGIALSVCNACMIVPLVNVLAMLPALILFIVYWVKIAEYARRLDAYAAPVAMPPGPQWS